MILEDSLNFWCYFMANVVWVIQGICDLRTILSVCLCKNVWEIWGDWLVELILNCWWGCSQWSFSRCRKPFKIRTIHYEIIGFILIILFIFVNLWISCNWMQLTLSSHHICSKLIPHRLVSTSKYLVSHFLRWKIIINPLNCHSVWTLLAA